MPEEPEERQRTLELVQDELDRMARIVNDLLLLARAQRPDFLQLAPLDVTALLEGVHARAVALGDRAWRLRPPDVPVEVVADRDRLMQALLNLVTNVTVHTPPETIATIGATLAPDGSVRLWVDDDGPGLDEQTSRRAFERFARGDDDRDGPASSGAGLGLAIVDAIATGHGGRVELDSVPGRGATFTIVLPAAARR
jgi:signal transduction histidine kinase